MIGFTDSRLESFWQSIRAAHVINGGDFNEALANELHRAGDLAAERLMREEMAAR